MALAIARGITYPSRTMKRSLVVVALLSLACSRSTAPHARPAAQPGAQASATPERRRHGEGRIMEAARNISPYPSSADGAQALVTDLARAAARHDDARLAQLHARLDADRTDFELAFTFDGARRVVDATVPAVPAQRAALEQRLATLAEPLQVTVTSATGADLAGAPHGFDPRFASLGRELRPLVRFYRVEVRGASGEPVVLEPLAYLGGQWTFLGEPWSAPSTVPTTPTTPTTVTAR